MDVVMGPLFWLVSTLIELYIWVIIIGAILSWLVAFNVVNRHNRFVYLVGDFTYKLTEPALRPIRNVLPSFGGVDISPLLLILLLIVVQKVLAGMYASLVVAG